MGFISASLLESARIVHFQYMEVLLIKVQKVEFRFQFSA